MTTAAPSTALATIQPAFTENPSRPARFATPSSPPFGAAGDFSG
jgi:hypothetical protein